MTSIHKAGGVRDRIARISVDSSDDYADNLAMVLAMYFEGHPDRPENDEECDETGWGEWCVKKSDEVLDNIYYEATKGN